MKITKIMDKCALIGYFIVSACEFVQGFWFSGIGWLLAGICWLAFDGEKDFFNQISELHKKAVGEYLDTIDKLKADLAKKEGINDSASIWPDMKNMDIDHILKVGRDFQNTDRWRGAHYDTVKLLCDTIEYLRKERQETK